MRVSLTDVNEFFYVYDSYVYVAPYAHRYIIKLLYDWGVCEGTPESEYVTAPVMYTYSLSSTPVLKILTKEGALYHTWFLEPDAVRWVLYIPVGDV